MKKSAAVLTGLCFVLMSLTPAHAWLWGKKKGDSQPASEQTSTGKAAEASKPAEAKKPAAPAISDKARDEALKVKRAQAQKKLNDLNNTEWAVEMSSMSSKNAKKEADTVTFRNNQVSIASYAKKGFPTTNFTLTVQEDGVVVWETMQTSEKSGIAFWRGEFDPKMENMRGVVSYQPDKKSKQDYSFSSTAKKNIPANPAGK